MPLDEPDLTGQIAFPGDPLVVGFGRERSNQTQARRFVRKNPYHLGPPSNLFIEPFQHVRRFHPTPMATRQPIHRERLLNVFLNPGDQFLAPGFIAPTCHPSLSRYPCLVGVFVIPHAFQIRHTVRVRPRRLIGDGVA